MVPEDLDHCPNCNVGRRSSALKKVLVAVSLTVSSCTACLPYGVPPCPDGTSDCYDPCKQTLADGGAPQNDPSTGCTSGVDGGTP